MKEAKLTVTLKLTVGAVCQTFQAEIPASEAKH